MYMCMDGIGCFQSVSVCFSGTVIIIIMQVECVYCMQTFITREVNCGLILYGLESPS